MATLKQISIEEIVLDEENPRLAEQGRPQSEILAAWSRDRKNQRLAADVAERGLSPLELVGVIPHPSLRKRFIVVDGNRRVTALKLLTEPSLAADASLARRFNQLAADHTLQEKVSCIVFDSREEADPWIDLRHSGESEGVGTVSWDTLQKYRFNARRGKPDPNADAVRFLELAREKLWISQDQQHAVPVTTLRRVLGDTKARTLLGVRLTSDGPVMERPEAESKRVVRTLIDALSERGAVRKIDRSSDREKFVRAQLAAAKAEPADLDDTSGGGGRKPASKRLARKKAQRETLIPRTLDFSVNQERCFDILAELQSLKVAKTPNAVVVLFRVFVELTADHYLERQGTRPGKDVALHTKITRCIERLDGTAHQLTAPKRQALEKVLQNKNHPLNPDTLNAFVHNAELHPIASELLKMWDQIQPLMSSIWRALA